jgi:hypothetical protein
LTNHSQIYGPIPDRKRGLSVLLRIGTALCFNKNRPARSARQGDGIVSGPLEASRPVAAPASTGGYFNERLTEVNLGLRLVPSPLAIAIMAGEMPAAINPYSMAVAPDSWARPVCPKWRRLVLLISLAPPSAPPFRGHPREAGSFVVAGRDAGPEAIPATSAAVDRCSAIPPRLISAGRMPEFSPRCVCTWGTRTGGVRNLPARSRRRWPASAVDTEGSADGESAKVLDQVFSSSP